MMAESLRYTNGKLLAPNAVFGGYIFIGLGFFLFAQGGIAILIGLISLLFGLFAAFTTFGVEVFYKEKEYTDYTNYFGLPIYAGTRKKLPNYPLISVVPTHSSFRMYSRALTGTTSTDYFSTVCLLSENYRQKKEISRNEKKEDAVKQAKELAELLHLPYFDYDPKVVRAAFLAQRKR